jgi:penicillin amidase/acyl-homoserine-lactone acylase
VVVALLLVAAVTIFWPVSEDLSYLADAGQGYDVRILRDTWGVPHVFGQTDADVAYGLAYAHAEDDFLTIQQTLAAARGHLARIYGPDAAPNDYMVQLLRLWDTLDAGYESGVSPEMRSNLDAYAAGLNYYAALHEDESLPGLFPVRGKDVAAGFMHKTPLFFGLDSVLTELFAEERQREISSGEMAQSRSQTLDLSPPVAPGRPGAAKHLVSTRYGSNTFAVGPARSANGDTFLAVNSHQPWEGPVTWYEAHLHSEEGWDTAGALFPGSPSILHGHNRHLGWAFTVNSPDLADVFLLEINPDDPNQYRFDDRWLDLEVREAPITVKLLGRLSWTVRRQVLWSVYGPTVRQDHGTYAIRYAGMGAVGLVEQFFHLNKARNLEEWQQIMAGGPLPMFNAGYADKEGNIYYLYNAQLPVRAEGYDWEQYLPGNTSQTLWTEYLPFEQLPQVLNPPSGFVQNANSTPFQTTTGTGNPDPAGYSPTLGIERHMSNRALRVLELFGEDESITADEFQTYKYDVSYSTDSDVARFVEMLADAPVPEDPDMRAAVDILNAWDLRTNPESRGATLAMLTLYFLNESEAADISPSRLVGNDVTQDDLMDSLGQAVDSLIEHFGRVDVPWEEVNRLRRGDVELGLGGGPDVLHAVYGELQEDGRLRGFVGDSYVMLVTWDANGNVSSRSIHQYGSATLDEESPHYADQAPLFASHKLKPVWLDESDIRDHLERAYRPGEEAE